MLKSRVLFLYYPILVLLLLFVISCGPRRLAPLSQPLAEVNTATPVVLPSPTPQASATLELEAPPQTTEPTAVNERVTPPNILLIIADDMGIDASPCYDFGSEKPAMPTLEQLCRDGLVFDQVWATPMCSSTRATLLTGRYGFRTGLGAAVGNNTLDGGISLNEVSIQQVLSQQAPVNYATAVIGKWHLSDRSNGGADNPTNMGVDYYAGLLAGVHQDYFNWQRTENGLTQPVSDYATTVFTNDALTWILQQQQPWFLWLAYTAPHDPFHLPPAGLHQHPELSGSQADINNNPLPYYLAMLEAMDHEIGWLLDSLPEDVRQNTVIIFLGDNGSPGQVVQTPYQPNRAKATLFEGGVHVPLVVAGAGVTRHGEREASLVNTTDLFATIAQLAGVSSTPTATDSISFAPLFTTASQPQRQMAYTEFFGADKPRQQRNQGWTIRDEQFKLMELNNGNRFLYNLLTDPAEQTNLLDNILAETTNQHLIALEEQIHHLRGN